ncbi:hypothetical protein [Bosea sp. R86505]|uniref:hypothetical protein n=1 Tax=Bosea sp. R86505 TaxID=3101710 RepID=UPI0036701DB9
MPDYANILIMNWGLRRINDDGDTLDVVACLHADLNKIGRSIEFLNPLDADLCSLAGQVNDVASEMYGALQDATALAEAEAKALWHGASVSEVDAALLSMREKVLRAWFPAGVFGSNGGFTCTQAGEVIEVSPGDAWTVSVNENQNNRYGHGLSELWSLVKDERHSVTVARLAQSLGIKPRRPAGATS